MADVVSADRNILGNSVAHSESILDINFNINPQLEYGNVKYKQLSRKSVDLRSIWQSTSEIGPFKGVTFVKTLSRVGQVGHYVKFRFPFSVVVLSQHP